MLQLAFPRRTLLQRLIARGYAPPPVGPAGVRGFMVADGQPMDTSDPSAGAEQMPAAAGGLLVVLPTIVGRHDAMGFATLVAELLEQLRGVRTTAPAMPLVLFLGIQWLPGEEDTARTRLTKAGALAREARLPLVGLSLRKAGKAATLNRAIEFAERLDVTALILLDDDIVMEPHCLGRMVARFAASEGPVSVGATKVGHPSHHLAGRILNRVKTCTRPAMNYPHGCCMVVHLDVVRGGIPRRYVSDDGYICFRLLDHRLDPPLARQILVADAICHHQVGGPLGQVWRRLRRMQLNHLVLMADAPPAEASYYLRHVLLSSLWPLSPWGGPQASPVRWLLKLIHGLLLTWFAAELILRGLSNRPLRAIAWGGMEDGNGCGESGP